MRLAATVACSGRPFVAAAAVMGVALVVGTGAKQPLTPRDAQHEYAFAAL